MAASRVLLLTGRPGVGKTTVIRKVAALFAGRAIGGFSTEEMRSRGERQGFRAATFAGREGMLARAGFSSPHRVGRYGVDLDGFEAVALPALDLQGGFELYLIDEIGKMECLSARFVAAVRAILDAAPPDFAGAVAATVALRGGGFIAEVKRRPDAELWEVTPANRDEMPGRVRAWLSQRL